MTKGKIIYTPRASQAISLDGAHYLSLDNPAFNFGTSGFAVDGPLTIDPAVADSECWIAAKGAANLASASGWHFYYKPATRRLGLRLNDGGATPLVVETADNQIPALGTPFWGRLQTDRGGWAAFYVNGFDVGGGSIAAKAGSLNNSEPFKVGGCDASTHRHKGSLDFLRFDLGRLLPAAWHAAEWDRIRYGYPTAIQDFLALWRFAGSLVDDSADLFTLAWQGGGAPAYVTGWPGSAGVIEYAFEKNFGWGHQTGFLDFRDRQRTLDASSFSYDLGASKRSFHLQFKNISPTQATVFDALWAGALPFWFYPEADNPAAGQFELKAPPLWTSIFRKQVDADLDMEEA